MNNETNWEAIAADFPINQTYIWFNSAGHIPPGRHVIQAINRFMETYAHHALQGHNFVYPVLCRNIKSVLSGLLGCPEDDVALIHNTAEGINFISHGLNLAADDEVLLLENEYPSNVYPWEHWKNKGVTLRFVPNALTPEDFIHNLKKSITRNTKVAALSAVHWCTGMPFPLKELSGICKEHNIELVLDISQGAGQVPVHIDEWQISFCAGSSWKWLQGPPGLAILVIKKEKIASLTHLFKGPGAVVSPREYFPYRDELIPTVERYVYSTPSLADWVYFDASLSYLAKIGFPHIFERIWALSEYLSGHLADLGFSVLNHGFAPVRSGIVVAEHKKFSSAQLVEKLKSQNIICADRGGRVRFSVHLCNTFEQIDRAKGVLKGIVG